MALAIIATSFNFNGVDSFQVLAPPKAVLVVGRRRYEPSIASLRSCNVDHIHHPHNIAATSLRPNHLRLQIPVSSTSTYLSATSPAKKNNEDEIIDSLILRTSNALRASSWLSWWSQVILTVISSITFLFARNVMTMPGGAAVTGASKFFFPALGTAASSLSIIWTWGQRRLARRFVRPRRGGGDGNASSKRITSRIEAANLLRSTIKFGVSINLFGLLTSVLGAQYIIGTLVAKSMQSFVGLGVGSGGGVITSQTLQPLDILVVQANTNVLSSHFISLVCLLWLTRMVDLLDPPSLEEDDITT